MNGQERFKIALLGFDYYEAMCETLGDEAIADIDRGESGRQYGGDYEHEQADGAFTFGALPRHKQAAILQTIAANLPSKNKRVNADAGTSYGLKHTVERYTGFYVSNLQLKTAMNILGYVRGGDDLNPYYNISKRERREFDERSRKMADARHNAHTRMKRQREERACARFFASMSA